MDVSDIEAGVDFVDVLERAVGSCDVLLAIVGREWLTCTDRNGRRRLDDPHDFIRLEIGTALARSVRVIPVLVEGAGMPTASELPSDLEGLTRRQAVELRDSRWTADVESLTGVLDRVLGPTPAANESSGNQPRRARLWGLAAAALVAALVAGVMLALRGGSAPPASAPQVVSGTPTAAEQRTPVQAEPPASSPSAAEERTNAGPAIEQPTTPAPPAAQPAPPSASSGAGARVDSVPRDAPPAVSARGGFLGWQLMNAADPSDTGTRGAIVRSVARGGPAAIAGFLPGDLVVEYGGAPVSNAASLTRLANASAPGDSVLIRVRRGSTGRTLEAVVGDRATAPSTSSTVLVHYAADEDQQTAQDLANELRASLNDPRYAVRTLKTPRAIGAEGEVRYSSSFLSTLADTLARNAGASLSRTYGRRVVFTPTVEPRVTARSVIVIVPGRTSAPAAPVAGAVRP